MSTERLGTTEPANLFPNAARARAYGAPPASSESADGVGSVPPQLSDPVPPADEPGPESDAGGITEAGPRRLDQAGRFDGVVAGPPATWGWRGAANRASGGLLRLGPGRPESRVRADEARVLRGFAHTQTVVVANPKGGAGKTPVTLLLSATFGSFRGGYVLAWDNNETRGTLGLRAEAGASHGAGTVTGLLGDIDYFLSPEASVGRLGRYIRPQSAYFDVLASNDAPGRMEMVDGEAFSRLHMALSRFYRLMVVDTGNNVRAANWSAAVSAANCLVVPTTVQADVADTGLWMLEHLQRIGRGDLVRQAVVVASCADPVVDQALLAQIARRYGDMVREVVVVPFDRAIQPGTRMSYRALSVSTRRALLRAAVAAVDSLSVGDEQRGEEDRAAGRGV